ncbi:MAG: hypothetical protein ACRD3R_00715, partial [Terriglobales bacterium]
VMIVLLNKFVDPDSVVMVSEFKRVAQAQGLIDKADNLLKMIARGETMSDRLISQIVTMSKFYEEAAQAQIQTLGDSYVRKAESRNLDPTAVVTTPYYKWKNTTVKRPQPGSAGERPRPGSAGERPRPGSVVEVDS